MWKAVGKSPPPAAIPTAPITKEMVCCVSRTEQLWLERYHIKALSSWIRTFISNATTPASYSALMHSHPEWDDSGLWWVEASCGVMFTDLTGLHLPIVWFLDCCGDWFLMQAFCVWLAEWLLLWVHRVWQHRISLESGHPSEPRGLHRTTRACTRHRVQ